MDTWLLYGLIAYLLFAFSGCIDKHMMNKQYHTISTGIFRTLFNGLFLCVIGLLFFQLHFSYMILVWAVFPSILFAAGIIIYYRFLKTKNASEITPLYQSLDILFIFLTSIFFLREPATLLNYSGIVFILIGVYLVVSENGLKAPRVDRSFLPLLLLIPLDVAYAMGLKKLLGVFDPVPLAISIYLTSAAMLVVIQFFSKKEPLPTLTYLKPRIATIFGASLFASVSVFFFYSALALGNASKIYPLAGVNSIVIFFLAILVLKERFYWHRLLGTLVVFIGIFLISF